MKKLTKNEILMSEIRGISNCLERIVERLVQIEHHIWNQEAHMAALRRSIEHFEDNRKWDYHQNRNSQLICDAIEELRNKNNQGAHDAGINKKSE